MVTMYSMPGKAWCVGDCTAVPEDAAEAAAEASPPLAEAAADAELDSW